MSDSRACSSISEAEVNASSGSQHKTEVSAGKKTFLKGYLLLLFTLEGHPLSRSTNHPIKHVHCTLCRCAQHLSHLSHTGHTQLTASPHRRRHFTHVNSVARLGSRRKCGASAQTSDPLKQNHLQLINRHAHLHRSDQQLFAGSFAGRALCVR